MVQRSWIEYEPDLRHAELIVTSSSLENAKGLTTLSSQEEGGRGVGDVTAVGRIADTTLSLCGDEGSVFVAGQTRSVILSEGGGDRDMQKPTEQSMPNP